MKRSTAAPYDVSIKGPARFVHDARIHSSFEELYAKLIDRSAVAGVIGLGYIGLPLSMAIARAGYKVIGFDVDPSKPRRLNEGQSYIASVRGEELLSSVDRGAFIATNQFGRLKECDVVVICVPTPATRSREPDLSYIELSVRQIGKSLRRGQLVVLESTTYPGTTREVVRPILDESGLSVGEDYFLGYSPEREDPGNPTFDTAAIPKIIAGLDEKASKLLHAFYGTVVAETVPVSSTDVAEAVKLTENIFRAVNIALVNELKIVFGAMGIDIWEVIEAAKTKPFGYMPFYPGPGLGGHCIPIDPFYLAWKARECGLSARFIELAGEVNVAMPDYVIEVLARALERQSHKSLSCARILILGLAYKKNVPDVRESPSLKLIQLLQQRGAMVEFHDPHVSIIPETRDYSALSGWRSVPLDPDGVASYDAVLISTDHDATDYGLVANRAKLIVDTRNVLARLGFTGDHVIKA